MVRNWFPYAVVAAVLYGLHQIFTKLAADRISDGFGGLIVEGTAVATIAVYLAGLYLTHRWNQAATAPGVLFSVITGICVGAGTIAFFLLFQRGGPLSAVPAILAAGAAMMAIAGIVWFSEPARPERLLGIVLALVGLYLVR
jgi:bacterial/archaeal transporter family protein